MEGNSSLYSQKLNNTQYWNKLHYKMDIFVLEVLTILVILRKNRLLTQEKIS